MRKLRTYMCLLLVFMLICVPVIISIGVNNSEEESNVFAKIDISMYSERYIKWLSLDEETRAKTIEPPMYEIEYKPKLTRGLSASVLPSKYSLTEDINIAIKNQKNTGECWAFASIGAVETNLALTKNETNWDFSERHMDYSTAKTFTDGINPNGFNREVGQGGTFYSAMGYYTSGMGPIIEENMPFENNENRKPLSYITGRNYEVQKKVEDYVFFPNIKKGPGFAQDMTEIRNNIKKHIMTYGSISAQVAYPTTTMPYAAFDGKHFNTYCNSTNMNVVNHAVSIVGWDDNYAVENFKEGVRPSKPGAYIIRGTWGTGNEADVAAKLGVNYTGYDYVSYEDYWIESFLVGVTNVENVDYDHLYQHDILGSNAAIPFSAGIQAPVVYGANVFTKETNEVEILSEIAIPIWESGTSYEVYVNTSNESLDFNNLTKVTGTISNLSPGYNTIEFNNPVSLTGTKFAVVVKYTVPSRVSINCYRSTSKR